MKYVLVFLGGVLFIVLVQGGIFLYFSSPKETAPAPVLTTPGVPADAVDLAKIKVTLVVPEPLKSLVKSGTGRLTVDFVDSQRNNMRIVPSLSNPQFPMELTFTVPVDRLASHSGGANFVRVMPKFCVDSNEGAPCDPKTDVQKFMGTLNMPVANLAPHLKDLSKEIDLGALYFTRNLPPAKPEGCNNMKVTIAGKITPSKDFLSKYGSGKVALVVLPWSRPGPSYDPKVNSDQLENIALHHQYLDFSKGPAPFSAPAGNILPEQWLFMAAVPCNAGEDLKACATGAFPLYNVGVPNRRPKFTVTGKQFLAPICGQSDYEGFVHSAAPTDQPLPLKPPMPQNAISPAEYVEGAYL